MVPLSDHEARLLEQMERALYAEDPKFADSLRKSRRANMDRRGAALGFGGILLGLGLLVAGVAMPFVPLGLLGFFTMLAGAFLTYRAVTAKSAPAADAAAAGAPAAPPKATGNGLMSRLEERWQQRKDRGQF